jgi:hypothetical protein
VVSALRVSPVGQDVTVTGTMTNTLDDAVNGHVDAVLFDRAGKIVGAGVGGSEADAVPPDRKAVFTADYVTVAGGPSSVAYIRATAGAARAGT